MVLNLGAGPTALTTAGAALSTASGGFYYAGVSNSTVHSCQLLGAAASNTADDLCEDLYPEQARLNYYLLVLNSVRILLTKAVAFNTLLTARALLCSKSSLSKTQKHQRTRKGAVPVLNLFKSGFNLFKYVFNLFKYVFNLF
ncbi:uncharacterized protein ACNS7B_019750 [Menidia menidia]